MRRPTATLDDPEVASFTWTPATGELRPCAGLTTMLDLDADDDRPMVDRVAGRLEGRDRDRLLEALREAHANGVVRSVDIELVVAPGAIRHLRATATRAMPQDGESVIGVVHDVTRVRQIERALEVRHAVTDALANWEELGLTAILASIGQAIGAQSATAWAVRQTRLLPLASWRAELGDSAGDPPLVNDVVTRARSIGLPVSGPPRRPDGGGGPAVRDEVAFPVVTVEGVIAVIELRSSSGIEVGETLARLLGAVGRELGAFFAIRSCQSPALELSAREREVLELVAEGRSAPEIAAQLVLSPTTVRRHIRNAYEKLGVNDRVSAVVKAMRLGLIE